MRNILSALKTLFRFKAYTIINIAGLVLSVAATLIIVRYIHQELMVDHFCKDLDQLHILTAKLDGGELGIMDHLDRNNDPNYINPLANPEVEKFSFSIYYDNDFILIDNQRYRANVLVTDSVFAELMEYPVVFGISAIREPDDAIITRKYAKQLFGEENPLGKQFTSSMDCVLTIRGIIDEPDTKASLQFDLITSYNQVKDVKNTWMKGGFTLVRLAKEANIVAYNDKISKPMTLTIHNGKSMQYQLFPMKKFYFDASVNSIVAPFQRGKYEHILILSIVTCMLLMVGIFNFINIYTVIMLKRAREFGIKKIFGASSFRIFRQIYVENMSMTLIALLFIWTIIEATSGLFASIFDISVKANWGFDAFLSLFILLGLPLITSIYPFLRYNYSSPITSLRSVNVSGHSIVSRMSFLFVQYVITFCLITVSIYFVRQLNTMLHAELGFRTKDIIITQVLSEVSHNKTTYYSSMEEMQKDMVKTRERSNYIKQRIIQKMNEAPFFTFWEHGVPLVNLEKQHREKFMGNDGELHEIAIVNANDRYLNMFDIQLKEGKTWNDKEQRSLNKVIINETAQKLLGIKNTNGSFIQFGAQSPFDSKDVGSANPPFEVIGIIKDFRVGHLSKETIPIVFFYIELGASCHPLLASIIPGKRKEAIRYLQDLHDEITGKGDFHYSFMEDEIDKLYEADKRTTRIYVTFAGLTIFISCLGLFGLSLYDIRQRYREIALRKVNGATGRQITLLLLRKYIYLLSASFVVSIPLAYYIINDYTKDFIIKSPISIDIFIIALIATLVVSLGTLLWQVHRAIRINPGLIMKSE